MFDRLVLAASRHRRCRRRSRTDRTPAAGGRWAGRLAGGVGSVRPAPVGGPRCRLRGVSRFGRRDEPGTPLGAGRLADISDPAVPDSLRRIVRPAGGRAHPHVLRMAGEHPRVLVAARPEALVHVSFADQGDVEASAAWSVAFVPWGQVEEIRVTGVSITFRWPGHSVSVEMTTHEEALQTVLFFLDVQQG